MKKTLLFTAFIATIAMSATAATLSPDEALQRLNGRTGGKMKLAAHKPVTSPRLLATGTDSLGDPTYYVFSTTTQTLFVGADDQAQPLLGYIDNPDFDTADMPPAMKWWLNEYSREIAWASSLAASNDLRLVRKAPEFSAIAPLIKTNWDQGAPYNNLCPLKNGVRTYTGCVATSTAQVMNYHKYPEHGTGTASYVWNNQTLTMDLTATTFDWANMLDIYPSATYGTAAQRTAVATLMKACGYAVSMNYGTAADGGSGAYSVDLRNALVNYFGYDKATRYEYRDFYTTDEWNQMIYDNLKNIGPVIYNGTGSAGGHSFVCDGYQSDGLFHINWGWSGDSDGYFKFSALDPESLGAGGGAGGFNYNQAAVLGLRKPQPGSTAPEAYIACDGTMTATADGLTVTFYGGTDSEGFYNFGDEAAVFTIGALLVNEADGSTVSVIRWEDRTIQSYYGFGSYYVALPATTPDGTYKLYPAYKTGGSDWKHVKFYPSSPDHILLSVNAGAVTINPEYQRGEIEVAGYSNSSDLMAGAPYSFTAWVSSTWQVAKSVDITPLLCVLNSNNSLSIAAEMPTVTVELAPLTIQKISFTGTLSSRVEPGTYYLVFADTDLNILGLEEDIEVVANDGRSIAITGLAANPNPIVAGGDSQVQAKLNNPFTIDATINLSAMIGTRSGSQFYPIHDYGTQAVNIPAGSTAIATFKTVVPITITPGTYTIAFIDMDSRSALASATMEILSASGIADITADQGGISGESVWFDLQGRPVSASALKPGIYIRQTDGKAEKVIIK